jgi:hypothetical protein
LKKLKTNIFGFGAAKAVPYLRRLVAVFPPRRPVFDPRGGYVGFVVDKWY